MSEKKRETSGRTSRSSDLLVTGKSTKNKTTPPSMHDKTATISRALESTSLEDDKQNRDSSINSANDGESNKPQVPVTVETLLERCTLLIAELEAFKEHLRANKQDQVVEIAHFRNTVKSEHRTLQRLADQQQQTHQQQQQQQQQNSTSSHTTQNQTSAQDEATRHTVNSSNLPFVESVWAVVKGTRGLQALQKRYYWHHHSHNQHDGDRNKPQTNNPGRSRNQGGNAARGVDAKKQSALVDVVGKDGLEWYKVSLITNARLLFDKAKQGWEMGIDSSDEDEGFDDDGSTSVNGARKEDDDHDASDDIPLIRMAKDLQKAASSVRIRTRRPTIHLILPKIVESEIPEIDSIIAHLRDRLDCVVETATTSPFSASSPPLSEVINTLLTNPFASLTPVLNIDCTILLALVSDFSHASVAAEPWFHRALKRQVEMEDSENLLPNLLYPALEGRELVCTSEAATRMREIVDTIGTKGERARTRLFMEFDDDADDDDASVSRDDQGRAMTRAEELQLWSKFQVPPTLRLPIKTVLSGIEVSNLNLTTEQVNELASSSPALTPATEARQPDAAATSTTVLKGSLPLSAEIVKPHLTTINQSVFLHGWATHRTTITSNRTVVRQIDKILDQVAVSEAEWPSIWLCPTARSLVGKEKGRQ